MRRFTGGMRTRGRAASGPAPNVAPRTMGIYPNKEQFFVRETVGLFDERWVNASRRKAPGSPHRRSASHLRPSRRADRRCAYDERFRGGGPGAAGSLGDRELEPVLRDPCRGGLPVPRRLCRHLRRVVRPERPDQQFLRPGQSPPVESGTPRDHPLPRRTAARGQCSLPAGLRDVQGVHADRRRAHLRVDHAPRPVRGDNRTLRLVPDGSRAARDRRSHLVGSGLRSGPDLAAVPHLAMHSLRTEFEPLVRRTRPALPEGADQLCGVGGLGRHHDCGVLRPELPDPGRRQGEPRQR